MKTTKQKRNSFSKEMGKLEKENSLKKDKIFFEDVLKKAVTSKKKPSGH